ncbi:MAG TPA: hypothetical protein VFM05_08750 [Candidatus Saccharimonadales bacterium]|nr:hypothetical protein [Candidatus Saccharimonadales bacterium]
MHFIKSTNESTLTAKDLNLAFFPENEIHLAIVAVDSTYFEVYAKDQSVVANINDRFTTVMLHDPIDYFGG